MSASPAPEQTVILVSLIVKGTEARARMEVTQRLNEWFQEDMQFQRHLDGSGFPQGSLLFWDVKNAVELPKPR